MRGDALALLARREHSRRELARKLAARGHDPDAVCAALDELSNRGLLSDARMAETYAAERIAKGFGPLRVRQELRERGVAEELVDPLLALDAQDWLHRMLEVAAKKYGTAPASDPKERARRARFLEHRGFPADLIARFLRGRDEH